jgi:hypothetical protein
VQAIGGGGSGSGDAGSGGGGGGASVKTLSIDVGQSATITVGGAGIPSGNTANNGGNTSVVFSGTTITAGGGIGASGGGGAGGISTGGSINLTGGAGSNFAGGSSVNGNAGSTSGSYGSAGGGGGMKDAGPGNFTLGGTSGGGIAGAGGNGAPQYPTGSLGIPGHNYGGGGGGGGNYSGMGGAGGQGVVVITYSGSPLATGGTITQTGGYTTHTFSNPGSDSFTVLNANSATIVIGSTLQLSNATAAGTWSSLNTSIAKISTNGLVTGIAVGTTTVMYSVTNSNGCSSSVSMSITVESTLPIELKSYEVKIQNNTEVLINWATASENNNSYFEVLKSTDGIGFKLLGKVEALGNSTKGYSYLLLDKTPSKGVNYYQLIQFDKDGSKKDLGIKYIRFDLVNTTAVNIYPNPTTNLVNVKFDVDKFETIEVLDLSGKLIFKKMINKTDSDIALDLMSEPSSIYLIKLSGKKGNITKQVIKK